MRALRTCLPQITAGVCLGLVALFMVGVLLSTPTVEQADNHSIGVCFRPGDMNSPSAYARQAADGELEDSDGDPRTATRAMNQAAITILSVSLSGSISIQKSQRPLVTIAGGSRPILYCRLTI